MKNVLVPGAAGFTGSHVAEQRVRLGLNVTGFDDLSGGFLENVPKGVEFVRGSVVDREAVERLWRDRRFDIVYHLAAYAAEGLSHFIRHFNYENNLLGSVNLINESVKHGCERFVFTSSIAVYGTNQVPMHEGLEPRPEDPYGISKYAVELDLRAAHEMFGLEWTVFRPHNVYGERQNISDRYRNVIGIFMNLAMKGESLPVFGDGSQTRAFSHVDDVAPVIARAPFVEGTEQEVFNVGADRACTVCELAEEVSKAMGVGLDVRFLPARNEVLHALASHEKVRAVFKCEEPVALGDGLARMAEWARSRGSVTQSTFGSIEIERNLPPAWTKAAG